MTQLFEYLYLSTTYIKHVGQSPSLFNIIEKGNFYEHFLIVKYVSSTYVSSVFLTTSKEDEYYEYPHFIKILNKPRDVK